MAAATNSVDPVSDVDHVRGPRDAKVTIVEYGDFECPNCKQAAPAAALLLAHFAGRICLVWRHFPLEEVHPHALIAAEAAEAAGGQGKFWEMHDLLFAHQRDLTIPRLRELAQSIQLEAHRFSVDLRDHVHLHRVRSDEARGRALGVRATPTFYVNGNICDVSFGVQELERAVAKALA
jgi:protein-disulfide isomerase